MEVTSSDALFIRFWLLVVTVIGLGSCFWGEEGLNDFIDSSPAGRVLEKFLRVLSCNLMIHVVQFLRVNSQV